MVVSWNGLGIISDLKRAGERVCVVFKLLRVKAIAVHWERRLVVLGGHELPSDEINEYARGGWPKADAKHLKLHLLVAP